MIVPSLRPAHRTANERPAMTTDRNYGLTHITGAGSYRRRLLEAAIPNRATGTHATGRVRVSYRKADGIEVTIDADSLGIAEQATTDLVDRAALILRTDALPLLMVPLSTITHIGDPLAPALVLEAEVAAGRACGQHDRPLPCLECQ